MIKEYVTDTHPLVWYLEDNKRLSRAAARAITEAETGKAIIHIPSIVFVELLFLIQRHRIPSTVIEQAFALAEQEESEIRVAPLDLAVARAVASFGPAAVPELPDRIIAATARALSLPLVTADQAIAESNLVQVIW